MKSGRGVEGRGGGVEKGWQGADGNSPVWFREGVRGGGVMPRDTNKKDWDSQIAQ